MQNKEFGSNFCEELEVSPLFLNDSNSRLFFDSGRSALRFLLNQIGRKISKVLLPEYICDSVILPFLECEHQIVYYPVDKFFKIKKEAFIDTVTSEKPQLIFVQTYFGIDTFAELKTYLEELREKDIFIIEDITHSLFSKHIWLDRGADYMIGSLRKWCSIPDGGILIVKSQKGKRLINTIPLEENVNFVQMRLEAQKEKRQYLKLNNNKIEKKRFIQLYDSSEKLLNLESKYYTMSQYTRARINSINYIELVKSRQSNFLELKYRLKDIPIIKVLDLEHEKNVVPLYCPIYVYGNIRNTLRLNLQDKNILLPVIWPKSNYLPVKVSNEVDWIYSHILAIPCDQRYRSEDLKEVVEEIKNIINNLMEKK